MAWSTVRQALIGRRKQVEVIARMSTRESNVSALTAAGPNMKGIWRLTSPITTSSRPASPLRRQSAQQIDRDIGVRSQAVFRTALDVALGNELADDIDAVGGNIARHVRVVGADIVTLRMPHIEQRTGIQKKFHDLHVVGHAAAVQIGHIVERHTCAEQPRHQRLQKAALEFVFPLRRAQAQCREYFQGKRRIAPRAPIELVGERVRLAHAQRQCQHNVRADAAQGVLNAFGNIVKDARHVSSWASAPGRN